jgi:hypothetical protein
MSESNNDNTNDTGAQGAWYGDVSAESTFISACSYSVLTKLSKSLYIPSACVEVSPFLCAASLNPLNERSKEHQFLDDGGATGTTEQAIQDEIYEITHKPEYMDDNKNKLLVRRVRQIVLQYYLHQEVYQHPRQYYHRAPYLQMLYERLPFFLHSLYPILALILL